MTAGKYTRWKCPICNHYLQRKRIKKSSGKIFYPMEGGVELDHFAGTHEVLFCSVCHYACKEPNPTRDIDEIVLPEYVKKYAIEGASDADIPLRCTKCLIRYKFGIVRTDKWIGADLYDDPNIEWYRCDLEEGHAGNHIATVETPKGVIKLEWGDHSDSSSNI